MDARQCDEEVSLARQWLTGDAEPATERTAAETAVEQPSFKFDEVRESEMNGAV